MVPPGAGFRVYGLEKSMRAGVRLGGPEKRTGPLRVMVAPGAGFRVYGLEKRMRAGVRLGGPEKRTGHLRVMVPPGAGFRVYGLYGSAITICLVEVGRVWNRGVLIEGV